MSEKTTKFYVRVGSPYLRANISFEMETCWEKKTYASEMMSLNFDEKTQRNSYRVKRKDTNHKSQQEISFYSAGKSMEASNRKIASINKILNVKKLCEYNFRRRTYTV